MTCKGMNLRLNSTPKLNSLGEDCPSPLKESKFYHPIDEGLNTKPHVQKKLIWVLNNIGIS